MPLFRVQRTKGRRGAKLSRQTIIWMVVVAILIAIIAILGWLYHSRMHVHIALERNEPPPPPVKQSTPATSTQPTHFQPVVVQTQATPIIIIPAHTNPAPLPAPVQPLSQAAIAQALSSPSVVAPNSPTPHLALPTNMLAILRAQIAMDRMGISSGSIDGKLGKQTRTALQAFQIRDGLPPTGELDAVTKAHLVPLPPVFTTELVTQTDITNLLPLATNWLQKSQQPSLAYATLLEEVAEKHHCHPLLIERLNPDFNWTAPKPGMVLLLPATKRVKTDAKATVIRIRLAARTLDAFDANNRLLAHFPCSIAQRVEKRPVGELRVAVIATNPDYTFDPELFPESPEAKTIGRKLIINPGPNNPVGSVWLGLNKPGYGIHGTPKPEDVGRTESKGCFRLANWNVEYLLKLVTAGPSGTIVHVEP